MKFIVSSGALLQALNITGKCIASRSIIPILDCYLFSINGNRLAVTASNNEVFLTTSIDIESNGLDKQIAVPSVQLSGLIKSIPEQPIHFEIEERTVKGQVAISITIRTATGSYTLAAEDGQHYPTLKNKADIRFNILADTLVKGVEKTLFAASTDELRPALTGVNISFVHGKAVFTATDASILSTFSYTANIDCEKSFIVPTKVLSLLLTSPKNETLEVYLDDKSIRFALNEEATLTSVLIDERYVDFQAVIPTANSNHLLVNRPMLVSALRRVIQLSDSITKSVKLSLSAGQCNISAEDTALAQKAFEELSCEYGGEPLDIGLMGGRLLDCLNRFDTSNVHLYFSTPNRAVLIRDHDVEPTDKNNLMLTMPIMLTNQ